jgi:hypothetical protein
MLIGWSVAVAADVSNLYGLLRMGMKPRSSAVGDRCYSNDADGAT